MEFDKRVAMECNPRKTQALASGFSRELMTNFVDGIVKLIVMFILVTEKLVIINQEFSQFGSNQEFTSSKGSLLIQIDEKNKNKFIKWFGKMKIEANSKFKCFIGLGNVPKTHVSKYGTMYTSNTWIGFNLKWRLGRLEIMPIYSDAEFLFDLDAISFAGDCDSEHAYIEAEISFMVRIALYEKDTHPTCEGCINVHFDGHEMFKECYVSMKQQETLPLSVVLSKGCSFNVTGLVFSDALLYEIVSK